MKTLRLLLVLSLFAFLTPIAKAGPLVQFNIFYGTSTYLGEVDVELYDKDKPITSSNFVALIQSGTYVGGFFHRYATNFVVQGGGFLAYSPTATIPFNPVSTNLGIIFDPNPITNEFGVGKFYSNTNWTIAMAKASDPNSASSQFYFNLGNNTSLDSIANNGGYTVFGHTVRGTNVLNFFNTQYQILYGNANEELVYGTNAASAPFTTLPNIYGAGAVAPPFNDLFYYVINVLTAKIKLATNGTRQISWLSVSGVTNNLEYCTNLNTTWQVLTNPVGNGTVMTYTDSTANVTRRFYRIHPLF